MKVVGEGPEAVIFWLINQEQQLKVWNNNEK